MSKKCDKDQYYTKKEVARYFSNIIKNKYPTDSFIEPSAGDGAFLFNFENIQGYDIDPKSAGIAEQNFLELTDVVGGCVFIGNPPFGHAGSLAVKFFNHCAKLKAKAICFILPKTFKKYKFQNKLNYNYNLVYEEDLLKNSFVFKGEEYNVPCVFQIWEYTQEKRKLFEDQPNTFFSLCPKQDADLAVRRVGGKAGMVLEGLEYSKSTTYFIKSLDEDLEDMLRSIYPKLKELASNTSGVRSIGVSEIVCELYRIKDEYKRYV